MTNKFHRFTLILFFIIASPLSHAYHDEHDSGTSSEQRVVLAIGVLAVIYAAVLESNNDSSSYEYLGREYTLYPESKISYEIFPNTYSYSKSFRFHNNSFNLLIDEKNQNHYELFNIKYNF